MVADEALHKSIVAEDELQPYRGGRLDRVLALANGASESPQETRLRVILVLAGLPEPIVQHSIYAGGVFLARVDLYYPDARLAIEYDGQTHRTSLVEDNRRQNRLLNHGIHLLRFTAADLKTPDVVVAQVRAGLARPAR